MKYMKCISFYYTGTLYKFENIANKFNSHRLQTDNHYPI